MRCAAATLPGSAATQPVAVRGVGSWLYSFGRKCHAGACARVCGAPGDQRQHEGVVGVIEFMPDLELDEAGLRRVATTRVAGYSNVPVRVQR